MHPWPQDPWAERFARDVEAHLAFCRDRPGQAVKEVKCETSDSDSLRMTDDSYVILKASHKVIPCKRWSLARHLLLWSVVERIGPESMA